MKLINVLLILFCITTHALSAGEEIEQRIYHTKPINPHPPTIDGRLDDVVWQKAEWQSDFTQWAPDDGSQPSEQTSFKILFDGGNLYVGIRAHDTEPDKIVRRVSRRDEFEGDWVEISLDSYHDRRTAFSFTINAAGVKGDEVISNDGNNSDSNWDTVWFGEVAVDSLGWTAELQIPFNQLRFTGQNEQVWGVQVQRKLFRKDERSIWQYIPQDAGGWVSYFGELRGLKGIRASRRLELLPYAVTDTRRFAREAGNPFVTGSETNFSGGLDAKVGIGGNMTMDVTINPDFGQVEADPSEVNLTAFESFFPEKRPFFVEGKNILDYKLMVGDGGNANDRLFYSRRVGRRPHRSPDLLDNEYSDQPDNTSILSAVKVTGKTQSGLSIGLLNAVTAKESAQIDFNGERREEVVEPLTNYFAGRLQKDYNSGNTQLGGMLTSLHRDLPDAVRSSLNSSAYSGGIDFLHQWADKTYSLTARTAFSRVNGSRSAISDIQQASQRYFQRPDANHVELDTTRTSLAGHGGLLNISRSGNSPWRFAAGLMWRSPGLELNDMGFLRQADRVMQWSWGGYRINSPVSIFRKLRLNFNQWAGWNFDGVSLFKGGNINGGGQLKNYWFFWLGVGREAGDNSTTQLRGGPTLKGPGWWNQFGNVSTDGRKWYQFGAGGSNNWADEGNSRRHNLRVWLRLRPTNAFSIHVRPSYRFNLQDMQYISTLEFETAGQQDRYIFGRLKQKTLGITLRLDYSITPNLSVQYYGQPFYSSGSYSAFKSITDPVATNYEDRFYRFSDDEAGLVQAASGEELEFVRDSAGPINQRIENPNFSFREFRSNLVVRWEYRPGSTLFLVWTQDRNGSEEDGRFSFSRGINQLFDDDASNVFLVKASRWFSL